MWEVTILPTEPQPRNESISDGLSDNNALNSHFVRCPFASKILFQSFSNDGSTIILPLQCTVYFISYQIGYS